MASYDLPPEWRISVDESENAIVITAPGDLDKGDQNSRKNFTKVFSEVFNGKSESMSRMPRISWSYFTAQEKRRNLGGYPEDFAPARHASIGSASLDSNARQQVPSVTFEYKPRTSAETRSAVGIFIAEMKEIASRSLPTGWSIVVNEREMSVGFTAPSDLDKGVLSSDKNFTAALRKICHQKPQSLFRLPNIQLSYFTAKKKMEGRRQAQLAVAERSNGMYITVISFLRELVLLFTRLTRKRFQTLAPHSLYLPLRHS